MLSGFVLPSGLPCCEPSTALLSRTHPYSCYSLYRTRSVGLWAFSGRSEFCFGSTFVANVERKNEASHSRGVQAYRRYPDLHEQVATVVVNGSGSATEIGA